MKNITEIQTKESKGFKEKLEIEFCIEAGKAAYAKGLKCVPAKDEKIMSVVADSNRILDTLTVLKAWILGWTQANLDETVI